MDWWIALRITPRIWALEINLKSEYGKWHYKTRPDKMQMDMITSSGIQMFCKRYCGISQIQLKKLRFSPEKIEEVEITVARYSRLLYLGLKLFKVNEYAKLMQMRRNLCLISQKNDNALPNQCRNNDTIETPLTVCKSKEHNYPILSFLDSMPGVSCEMEPKSWMKLNNMLAWMQEDCTIKALPDFRLRIPYIHKCSSLNLTWEIFFSAAES